MSLDDFLRVEPARGQPSPTISRTESTQQDGSDCDMPAAAATPLLSDQHADQRPVAPFLAGPPAASLAEPRRRPGEDGAFVWPVGSSLMATSCSTPATSASSLTGTRTGRPSIRSQDETRPARFGCHHARTRHRYSSRTGRYSSCARLVGFDGGKPHTTGAGHERGITLAGQDARFRV